MSRLLGSWLPAPDADLRRNDLYTFNPDGVLAISDGAGMNLLGRWQYARGALRIDGRAVDLELQGDDVLIAGARFERFRLHGEDYDRAERVRDMPLGGAYVPDVGSLTVGAYQLHFLYFDDPDRADEQARVLPPILVQFWKEDEPILRAESGGAYRESVVEFLPHRYELTPDRVKFHGVHPQWGEIYFNGAMESAASRPDEAERTPALVGDLMVRGFIFRDLRLIPQSLH